MAGLTRLAQSIIVSAVDRLPAAERSRWYEEWAADLLSCSDAISQSFRALGIGWAAVRISISFELLLSRLRGRTLSGAGEVDINQAPPKNLLESMGRKLANECTRGERRALKRMWYNPGDASARKEADRIFRAVAARLSAKQVRSQKWHS